MIPPRKKTTLRLTEVFHFQVSRRVVFWYFGVVPVGLGVYEEEGDPQVHPAV